VDGQMMSDGWATPSRPPIATPTLPTICARPSKHAINCPKIMFYTTCRKLRNSREVGQKREKKGMGWENGAVATAALQLTAIIAAKIVLFVLLAVRCLFKGFSLGLLAF